MVGVALVPLEQRVSGRFPNASCSVPMFAAAPALFSM